MNKIKLRGINVEEKIIHIERILQHFNRRLGKTIIGVIPPSPIFSFVAHPMDDGKIMSCAIPAEGRIQRGVMVIDDIREEKEISIICRIDKPFGSSEQIIKTKKNVQILDISFDVDIGNILTISTPQPKVKNAWVMNGIWITLLYDIQLKHNRIEHSLIEGLDRISDERVRELNSIS